MNPEQGHYIGEEIYLGNIVTRYYREEKHLHLRFGQYFINQYMSPNTVWPTLFYEKDTKVALGVLVDYMNRIFTEREAR